MQNSDLLHLAERIASNREAGASELLAQLLPVLHNAIAAGHEATIAVVRTVCRGQPAMAALWNAGAAALVEFQQPGRFTHAKAEMERAPRALARVAIAAITDALSGEQRPQVLTLSYSSGVATALSAIAKNRRLEVVCAESLPGGEGARMQEQVASAGAEARLVGDAVLTTYLATASAVVVGADAISACDWTNKCGTFGLCAAASVVGRPVYVVASRDKAQAAALRDRVELSREFERTPAGLATLFLTDTGALSPVDVPILSERYARELETLLALL